MWSAPESTRLSRRHGGAPSACSFAAPLLAVLGLLGCNFADTIDIGRDEPGGASGAGSWAPAGGSGGAGGFAFGGAFGDVCGVGVQTGQIWVNAQASSTILAPGSGGPLQFGEYRLNGLTAHGPGMCFTAMGLAQTLAFRDGGRGTVISDFRGGGHFSAAFTFAVGQNSIDIKPTCTFPDGPMSEEGSFGPFETYTATNDSLVLVSEACNYSANYFFMPIPAR